MSLKLQQILSDQKYVTEDLLEFGVHCTACVHFCCACSAGRNAQRFLKNKKQKTPQQLGIVGDRGPPIS